MYLNSELRTVHINKVLICATPAQQQKPDKNDLHTYKSVWECYCYVAEDAFAYIYSNMNSSRHVNNTALCTCDHGMNQSKNVKHLFTHEVLRQSEEMMSMYTKHCYNRSLSHKLKC